MKRIEKIVNPYIPKDYDGSMDFNKCCSSETSDDVPKAWLTKYTEIQLPSEPLRSDTTGAYTPQGGCVDGPYIYRAMVKEDNEPAIIQKIRITDGSIVKEITYTVGHANDMFVQNDKLYILHSSSTNIVYEFTLDLEFLAVSQSGPTRWGQAYNSTDNLYVIGTVGSAYFSVYYADGGFMYRIKPDNAYSGLVRQGIFCDDNYIGVVLDNAYGAVLEPEKGSRIMFYTWNGMFIKSVYIPITEIEWADFKEGKLYFGTYNGRDENNVKSGEIYVVPFDLYPEQTELTGRPTDVSGGLNNLQRLPEGTPVKLWEGTQSTGEVVLFSKETRLIVDEDGPFRYLKFKYDGANACVGDWFPTNGGTICLREFDITAAEQDSNIRFRELRMTYNETTQTFTLASNLIEQLFKDISENKIEITKQPEGLAGIKLRSIWGII